MAGLTAKCGLWGFATALSLKWRVRGRQFSHKYLIMNALQYLE